MPTENRSSNTEMVSVPRETVESAAELLQEYNKCGIARDLRSILAQPAERHHSHPSEDELIANGLGYPIGKEDAVKLHYAGYRSEVITILEAWEAIGHDIHINPDKQELMESLRNMAAICAAHGFDMPAEQHQGEPVALAVPDECPHIIVFDDADRENEHFCGAGARPAALRRYEQISQSWNAHLFVRIARNSRDDSYPSATAADPGEVERLRAELAQCEAMAAMVAEHEWAEHVGIGAVSSKVEAAFTQLHGDLHEARDKLAEWDALLAEIEKRHWSGVDFDLPADLVTRIKALSASAEPEPKS